MFSETFEQAGPLITICLQVPARPAPKSTESVLPIASQRRVARTQGEVPLNCAQRACQTAIPDRLNNKMGRRRQFLQTEAKNSRKCVHRICTASSTNQLESINFPPNPSSGRRRMENRRTSQIFQSSQRLTVFFEVFRSSSFSALFPSFLRIGISPRARCYHLHSTCTTQAGSLRNSRGLPRAVSRLPAPYF